MSSIHKRFDEVLESVETLPQEDRQNLVDIVQNRLRDQKREQVMPQVQEAREQFAKGEYKNGSAEELMKDLEI